ncbi:hypothetical protein [Serratia quinivorans]
MSEVQKVITVADRSTKSLIKATGDLSKVVSEIQGLAQSSVLLSEEIEFKQSELVSLTSQFDAQYREQTAELRLKVIENEDSVLAGLMKSRGYAVITGPELNQLKSDLQSSQSDNTEALASAKEEGARSARAEMQNKLNQLTSDHRVEIAELNADSKAKDSRIEFLEEQNESLKEQIAAERETRLEIAKADAGRQGVTVNTGKN